jgi:hypothetical protein
MDAPAARRDARIAELYELEEAAYRGLFRRAEASSILSVRALLAHVNASLDALRPIAEDRRVSLGSPTAVLLAAVGRLFVREYEQGAETLFLVRRGIGVTRAMEEAAREEGDEDLALWCRRWLRAREQFVDDAATELGRLERKRSPSRARALP